MSELKKKPDNVVSIPMFNLAFRPMFLCASVFSIFALVLWGLTLADVFVLEPYGGSYFWHAHEMVFGFVSAVLVGFLLTAAQNWTGIRAPHGKQLVRLVTLWFSARLFMLAGDLIPFGFIVLADLSFTALAAFYLYDMLLEKRQYRNYFAVVALLLITFCNGLTHFSLHSKLSYNFTDSIHASVIVITMMMIMIGGRVIPLFTANATRIRPRARLPWLDNVILFNVWMLISIYIINIFANVESAYLAVPFFSCAFLIAIRSLRWRFWSTTNHPLLWSLHLSYWFIPIGLFFIGLHHSFGFNLSLAIHTLTVGAMGGMILSMMSRVSLGHTGRPIMASKVMTISFVAIIVAAIVRVAFITSWPEAALIFLWFSISLWVIGYSLFVLKFGPFLVEARLDGKEG